MAPAETTDANSVTGPPIVGTVRTTLLLMVVPGMSPRSPKRNFVVVLVYVLVLWVLCAHLLTAVSGGWMPTVPGG